MITRNSIKKLIAHPAIMQQKTLIEVIKRHNSKLSPLVFEWVSNNKIPDLWVERLNEIPAIKNLDLNEQTMTSPLAKEFARARFNEFVAQKGLNKCDVAKALGMAGDCGQGVQRWKKTGVGKNSVKKFVEVFGESGGYWRPDLGYLRFDK
jgi:hypothetical protein